MATKTDKATFTVQLKDDVSRAAKMSTRSLEQMKKAVVDDTKRLKDMQSAMGKLKGSSGGVATEKKKLAAEITKTKDSIAKSTAAYMKGGGKLDALSASAKSSGGSMSMLRAGAATAATAYVAFAAAVAVGVAALFAFGVASVDSARSARLLMEAQTGSAADADALGTHIDAISKRAPIAKEALRGLVGSLTDKGLQGNLLAKSLSAVGMAQGVLGQGAGAKVQGLIEQAKTARRLMIDVRGQALAGTGINLDDLAGALAKVAKTSVTQAKQALVSGGVDLQTGVAALDTALQSKLGGIAKKQLVSLPSLLTKAKEGLAGLADGLKIDGLLEALDSMLGMFDKGTSSGKALRAIFSGIVQPMIDGLVAATPYVQQFIMGFLIGALEVYNAVLRLGIWLVRLIPKSLIKDLGEMTSAMDLGQVAAYALGGVLALMVPVLLAMAAPILAIGGAILGIAAAVREVKELMETKTAGGEWTDAAADEINAYQKGTANVTTTSDMDLEALQLASQLDAEFGPASAGAGADIVDGLIAGVDANEGAWHDRMTALAKGGADAFDAAIGRKSPAKRYIESAEDIGAGLQIGIQHSAPDFESDLQTLGSRSVDAFSAGASTTSAPAAPSASTKAPIVFRDCTFIGAPEDWFEREIARVFDRAAQVAGAAG